MPTFPTPPNAGDEDREFKDWLNKREPPPDEDTAANAFMAMMRQAAERAVPAPDAPTDLPEAFLEMTTGAVPITPIQPPPPVHHATPPIDKAQTDAIEAVLLEAETEEALPRNRVSRKGARKNETRVRRGSQTLGMIGGFIRSFIVVIVAAGLTATIFTWFTPPGFINAGVRDELSNSIATDAATRISTERPTPNWERVIGVVSGHRGPQNDPGAVCADGLTEAEINFNVAQQVVQNLRTRGYTVDLLDEFDPRLDNYQAAALVSIHANDCRDYGEVVSGYLIAAAAARVTARGNDQVLVDCISRHYAVASQLQRRAGVTVDMTDYHTFREIHPLTPAAILELGFLRADRALLTEQPGVLATGITNGILCFMEPGTPFSGLTVEPPTPTLQPLTSGA